MKLHPWQEEAIPAIRASLMAGKRPIVDAATGVGKSVVISHVAAASVRDDSVVLVATPRLRLVDQLADEIRPLVSGVTTWDGSKKSVGPVVVACYASLATFVATKPKVRMILIDEAHLANAAGVVEAVAALAPRYLCGFSATPYLSDARKSLVLFDDVAYRYQTRQAIDDGVLCPFSVEFWTGEGEPDSDALTLEWVRKQRGPGLVTCTSITDADDVAARYRALGIDARAVHSGMTGRQQNAALRHAGTAPIDGPPVVLCYVTLLRMGVNVNALSWLARRAFSDNPIDVVQSVGRLTRLFPNKTMGRVFDVHATVARNGMGRDVAIGLYHRLLDGDASVVRELYGPPKLTPIAEATAVTEVEAWFAALALGVGATPGAVRLDGFASPEQRKILRQGYDLIRTLPKSARDTARELCECLDGISGLAAANLIAALVVCADRTRAARKSWLPHNRKMHRPVPMRVADVVLPVVSMEVIEVLRQRKPQGSMW